MQRETNCAEEGKEGRLNKEETEREERKHHILLFTWKPDIMTVPPLYNINLNKTNFP